ncbi:MAG: DegT/DnrJ/EryC1/StrS family aminotransferase [Nanoarchaeota archaeon]
MKTIRWNEPRFDAEDLANVSQVLQDNYVNEGPKTKELEEQLQKYLGVKHVIMTCNGTTALYLALRADKLIRNLNEYEVLVPDMTMLATATAVSWAGGNPVLCDVEKQRYCLDIDSVRKNLTPRTKAILPVHVLGKAANMQSLQKIAEELKLTIIEDAAGALGSKDEQGRMLGTIGKVGCFSMQSNKIITSGQGGFVVTNDTRYHETMRRIRDFGRFSNKEFLHEVEGYNLKFSDLAAALALGQLKKIEQRKQLLRRQFELYHTQLSFIPGIVFPEVKGQEVPLWIDPIVPQRKELITFLNAQNIFPRECWSALHHNKPYWHQGSDEHFPNASFVSSNVLWLPNGPHLNEEEILYVSQKIKEFYTI